MARNIFIFSNIVVYFLTIVSNQAFSGNQDLSNYAVKVASISGTDTVTTVLTKDFETGELSEWNSSVDWEVSSAEKLSGDFSLKHLSKGIAGVSTIFHPLIPDLKFSDVVWKFTVKNGNWDPSSSNKFWVYLSADTIESTLINGWAVGVNISGSADLLALWRIRNGKADSLVVETDLDWNASTIATIQVKRTSSGNWAISYQLGEPVSIEFNGTDNSMFEPKNLGFYFKYTSTRAGQLWIDDLSVSTILPQFSVESVNLINAQSIRIAFNFAIDAASLDIRNFGLTDEIGKDIQVNFVGKSTISENCVDLNFEKVTGTELNIHFSGIKDLNGRTIKPVDLKIAYSIPPEIGSVLINEILFNPFAGGVDFVELVNVSEQTIPLHCLMLASRNDTLALKQIYSVSAEERYLYPGQFLVCTKDSAIVAAQYFTSNTETFCLMKTLPGFSDDAGTVVLQNDSLEVLDEFSYTAKMHSPFLASEDGVSLERISLEKPTADRSNWASAAASVGFATPGLPNSQTESETKIQDEITPEPKAFSPNGDGYNDELAINYSFSKPGYIANVRIFDIAGRQVKFLIKNQSSSQEGNWLWDGKSESGQKLGIGAYIILVEVFDQEGSTKAFKKTCTITDRLE
jgi:hypothetical protein